MGRTPANYLFPLAAAILVHAAAFAAVAVLWHTEMLPIALSERGAQPDPIRFLIKIPAPNVHAGPRVPERAPGGSIIEPSRSGPGTPDLAPPDDRPSTGVTVPATEPVAGAGWAYRPTQPSSRFTEATLRSVVTDLPPRLDCAQEHLQQFHCISLQSGWSLDSSIRVNLNCARIMLPRQHYAECVRHPTVAIDTPPQERAFGEGAAPE